MEAKAAKAMALALALFGCAAPAATPRPLQAGDCFEVAVWSNGVHTSLSIPAEALPPDHPFRRLYPEARHLLIGWGDAAFYRSDGTDWRLGLRALIPPSPSAVHVLASDTPAETWFTPTEAPRFGIDRAGAVELSRFLAQALETGADGAPKVLSEGQVPGASVFLAGREGFHAFNVCNHWTARALRAAGLDVRGAWSAEAVKRQVRGLPRCPV